MSASHTGAGRISKNDFFSFFPPKRLAFSKLWFVLWLVKIVISDIWLSYCQDAHGLYYRCIYSAVGRPDVGHYFVIQEVAMLVIAEAGRGVAQQGVFRLGRELLRVGALSFFATGPLIVFFLVASFISFFFQQQKKKDTSVICSFDSLILFL